MSLLTCFDFVVCNALSHMLSDRYNFIASYIHSLILFYLSSYVISAWKSWESCKNFLENSSTDYFVTLSINQCPSSANIRDNNISIFFFQERFFLKKAVLSPWFLLVTESFRLDTSSTKSICRQFEKRSMILQTSSLITIPKFLFSGEECSSKTVLILLSYGVSMKFFF